MRHAATLNKFFCTKPARKIALRSSVFVLLAWTLSGCEPQNVRPDTTPPSVVRPPVIEQSAPTKPTTPPPEIAQSPEANQGSASDMRSPRPPEITPTTLDPVSERLSQAEQALAEQQPTAALERINSLPLDALSESEMQRALRLKERAFDALDLPVLAIQTGLERLQRSPDPVDESTLQGLIDRARELPDMLKQLHRRSGSQLAGVIDALALGPTPSESAVARWQRRYPNHLLTRVALDDFEALRSPVTGTAKITVLLPFTGPLGTAGRAVRDGLVAAWMEHADKDMLALSLIDSTTLSETALSQLAEGVSSDLIIGPLDRNQLMQLAQTASQIPILGLNRLPDDNLGHDQLFQLALAVEDDAGSAVEWAQQSSPAPRVLALVSDSPLGDRTAAALEQELTAIGGSTAGIYVMGTADNGALIADALGVNASESRRRDLSRLIGLPLTSTPRIRQDLTAVVVQSDAQTSRQIRPLLTYYYLRDVPVYVMGGFSPALESYSDDLANSSVLVMPWDLGTPLKDQVRSVRPEADAPIGSLMALGADAFEVARRILQGEPLTFLGETGYLALSPQGVFTRQLHRLDVDRGGRLTVQPWLPPRPLAPLETSERAF